MSEVTYLIDNLGLARFLAAKDLKLLGTEPAPNKRDIVAFRFADPQNEIPALIADYYANGTVIAREFDAQLSTLKGMIWEWAHPEQKRRHLAVTPNYFDGGGRR